MVSVASLCHCDLFTGLSDDELALIAAIASEEEYQAGGLICAEEGEALWLYILREGRVQVQIRLRSLLEPEADVVIEEVEAGSIFGWSSLVKQRRFTASVRALQPVRVLVIKAEDLNDLFNRNPHIGFVVMKQLAEVIASRLRHTREQCQHQQQVG